MVTYRHMMKATDLISHFHLLPLPDEGGFFRQTYRSEAGTAIYYLLTPQDFSAFHTLNSDEIYHFYVGDPVELLSFTETGTLERTVLGAAYEKGEVPQAVVTKNRWQASRLMGKGSCALLGTTMAPGFTPSGFTLGKRDLLTKLFPAHRELIGELTRA